ncbi:hypothetical protein PP175_23750 [Aneurinibacillus sp. Ricciae_BoGa-3]|nr:hypothetical protein [Aneurinibacillus sp. Ricciae_BoGa-3]WCK54266.1 hypothetical protein PP175_23750 [Aneurinibacillus sp. Ricciae_BoGa-3]
MDKQDNSFTQFWNYVLVATTNAHPDLEIGNWPKKDSFHESFYSPMITALINGLNALPHELVLILDDFHVIQQPSIHTSLSYLLEVLPPHIHLYIASRSHTLPANSSASSKRRASYH